MCNDSAIDYNEVRYNSNFSFFAILNDWAALHLKCSKRDNPFRFNLRGILKLL